MRVVVFDTETSGIDVFNDRILTCHVARYEMTSDKFELEQSYDWIIDPGIEVPKEASDVNGLTTEYIRENGRKDWDAAIHEIWEQVICGGDKIISAYNLPFDMTMLASESLRAGNYKGDILDSLGFRDAYIPEDVPVFFDSLVYDKATDKYRKGSRKLMDVAKHHGIEVDETMLHEARYDVHITAQLTYKFLDEWFRSRKTTEELKRLMRSEKFKQAKSLQEYFRKTDPEAVVDGGFPIYTSSRQEWA